MDRSSGHRPGDIILDHFVPHLDDADRELARERLQQFASWLVGIAMRQAREEMGMRNSRDSDSIGTIEITPPSHP
jgi:hypothetical protein